MKPLLFLTQRMPYPPNKGDKLRSFAVLRHLAKSHEIHLGCFVDDPDDWQHVEVLRSYCASLCCLGMNKGRRKILSLTGLARGQSLSEVYFRSGALARWVDGVLRDVRPEAAFLYSSVMGQYIPSGPLRPERVVMDFVDADSIKWRQYSEMRSWPMSWVYQREFRTLLAFDRKVAAACDANIFVSEAEAALFCRFAPEVSDKVHAVSNGIDHAYFTADPSVPSPLPAGCPTLVMTGAMDYWPNIDGALWFADAVFPALRARVPDLYFVVVGGNPTPEVIRLGERPGIIVTGRVPDVRPYLTHASAVVAPLRVARGIQNKVLEGMAMGKIVVTTPQGLEGLDATPGEHLLVAERADALVTEVLRALTDTALTAMGAAARARILAGYDWDDKLAEYDRLLAPCPSAAETNGKHHRG